MQKRWAKLRRGDKEEEKREVRGGGGMRSETEEERGKRKFFQSEHKLSQPNSRVKPTNNSNTHSD